MKHTKTILVLVLMIVVAGCESKIKKPSETQLIQEVPRLKRPEVRRVWVPNQIVGDEFISGHWKYVIEKNVVWTKSEE